MKRELKPFVVEVKRGKRRLPFGGQVEILNARPTEASRRADVALFAASPIEPTRSKSRSSEAIGRILPSLIEVASVPNSVREEAPLRRRGRKPGSKNKAKAPIGAGRAAPEARMTPGQNGTVPNSAKSSPDAAVVVHGRPGSSQSESEAAQARRPRLRERSAILARYVFQTDLVPGERWKRSSRKVARVSRFNISV